VNDGIYRRGRGSALVLDARQAADGQGYTGSFNIGLRI